MARSRYTVHLNHLGGARRTETVRVYAASEDEARNRGIARLYGRYAFWYPDSGLGRDYGQVFEDITTSGESFSASSCTGRASLYVTPGWEG